MKRVLTAVAIVASGIGFAGPVSAGNDNGPPPGLQPADLVYECDGGLTATVSSGNGRSGWINGEKWALVSIDVTYDGDSVYSKEYGNGPSGDTMSCSATDGLFEVTINVVEVQ